MNVPAICDRCCNIAASISRMSLLVYLLSAITLSAAFAAERGRPMVVGGTLKTDTGQIIRSGASVMVTGSARDATNPAVWDAARALGLNTMRVGVKTTNAGKIVAQQLSVIDQVVEIARAQRMYVMLLFGNAPPGEFASDVVHRDNAIAFWKAAAPRYAKKANVFYELVNEPEKWGNVVNWIGPAPNNTPTRVFEWIRQVYDATRAGAPDTVILLPSVANLQSFNGARRYVDILRKFEQMGPVNWSKTVWSFHYYNGTVSLGVNNNSAKDGGRAALSYIKARYPILCTETNWWMEPPRSVLINGLEALEDVQVGWTLLRRPNQTTPPASPSMEEKLTAMRKAGRVIPVE